MILKVCFLTCLLTFKLWAATNTPQINSNGLYKTPRHRHTQPDFTPTWPTRPTSTKQPPQKSAAWAVHTSALLLICNKEGDPHSAGRQLDPRRDHRYPLPYVVSRAGTPKKRAVFGLARCRPWDIADSQYPADTPYP